MDEQKVSTTEDIERSDPKDAEEQFQLAQRYFKGSGTKKNYEKAAEWYGKLRFRDMQVPSSRWDRAT